ncbi:MAG: phosphoenolpyruvate carboxylase [Actinomycetota bacterium]|nr:phosphoenolpyruvate carboxylase [Actinomycetota bacterium]
MEELRIPTTMMTQHPDAASKYISIQEEPDEAIFSLTPLPEGLGLEEAMVDFEGKLTPYMQTSQVVLGLLGKGIVPGRDVFITPRIPSGIEESVFRQLMALMSIVEANYHAWKRSRVYAVREVISPMCTGVQELLSVRERIIDVIELAHKEFGLSRDPNLVQLIPLVETVPQILDIYSMLKGYIEGCQRMGLTVSRLRFMLGRSDLALSYGMVPAILSNKIAIAEGYRLARETGINICPILGGGTLPFRGHFTLENVNSTLKEYGGIRTLTVQSGMRYDHGYEKTRKLVKILQRKLPFLPPLVFDESFKAKLMNIMGIFTKHYLHSFYEMAEPACCISDYIPQHRDRLTRKGEVGYARDLPRPRELARFVSDKELVSELESLELTREIELPRVISYTAALYSIGLPPEIIGTGRGLHEVLTRYGENALKALLKTCIGLKKDLSFACRFVHLKNAGEFLPSSVISQVEEDLKFIEDHLGIKVGIRSKEDRFYATILETMKPMLKQVIGVDGEHLVSDEGLEYNLVREWVIKLGTIRKSLG